MGFGQGWADLYANLQTVARQARFLTTSGPFLDLAVRDFRPSFFQRRAAETDAAFLARFLPVFPDKVDRAAVSNRITAVTGHVPVIVEPSRPADTGGYGVACGYGVGGRYGSLLLPFQFFADVERPAGEGLAGAAGYGTAAGGYGVGAAVYGNLSNELPHTTDADIYAAINAVRPAASTAWVRLVTVLPNGPAPLGEFVLGVNSLA